jgi:hypothetical protein
MVSKEEYKKAKEIVKKYEQEQLNIPDVIKGEAEQVCETCNTKQKETIILCKECYLERAIP